jgi:hypothetical protein
MKTAGCATLLALAALLAACAPPVAEVEPVRVVVGQVDTATSWASRTVPPDATATATETPIPPTRTPTDSPLRTKTPAPTATATNTAPTATRTRAPVVPPTRTATTTPGGARAAIGPAPDTSAHGASATFTLEARNRTYKTKQKIWFRFVVTNLTESTLNYGFLGVVVSDGSFHTSWSGSSLAPLAALRWRDWVAIDTPGDYTITLSMCFSPQDLCRDPGSSWVPMSAPVPVTITE